MPVDWLVFLAIVGVMTLIISGGIGLSIVWAGSGLPWSAVPSGVRLAVKIGAGAIAFALFVHLCGWFEIVNIPGGMDASWLPRAAPEDEPSPAERVDALEEDADRMLPAPLRGVLLLAVVVAVQVLPRTRLWRVPVLNARNGGTPWSVGDVVFLGGGTAAVLLLVFDGVWRYARIARSRSTGPGGRT